MENVLFDMGLVPVSPARATGYARVVRQQLPLSDREVRDLLDDRAPYLPGSGSDEP
jgi:hypothetical protein